MVGPSMINTNKYNLSLKSAPTTIKFLCSYGGKILPRYPDGKLRYHGGETRVFAFERSISFSELVMKLGEMCGKSVNLRCQLPTEDMDALVSITSDEDLGHLIEEYDQAAASVSTSPTTTTTSIKIRAFISIPKSTNKKLRPSPSTSTSNDATSANSAAAPILLSSRYPIKSTTADRCIQQIMFRPAVAYPRQLMMTCERAAAKGLPCHQYLIHHGKHQQ